MAGSKMTRPQLSICIATYNRASLLRETLTHLSDVCDDDVEIVVSDNASPDDTQDVINSFAERFRYFRAARQPTNRGPALNFAAAMSVARGKYLYPFSDDDQILMEGLQNAISIMEERPEIVAVYGRFMEWHRSTGQTFAGQPDLPRMDFARGSHLEIIEKFSFLWFPVCRTDIFQRFCTFNKNSVGTWEIVGSFLRHGDVSVIPDFFYKHADTEPRAEYKLTEGSEHDAIRADFESFFGRMGQPFPPESLALWLHHRTTPHYMLGARFGQIKHDLLTARHFLLRCRACGRVTKEELETWEKEAMLGMLAERILQKVELLPEIDTVVFEASPRLAALCEKFAAIAPRFSLQEMSEETFRQCGLRANQLFVTVNRKSFESGATADAEPTFAMADLIETCRLTDQPWGFERGQLEKLSPHKFAGSKMTGPPLSICIATYNRANLLREALTHLSDVCPDDVEIVVSDNASPDDTQDIIKSFAERFRYFRAVRQPTNQGPALNFAAAMSLARGKYLYPFSDDDQIHMKGLQRAISIMEERPKIVAVYGRYEEWQRSTGQTFPNKPARPRMDFAQGSHLEIINKFSFLWFPVCQADVFQRFSTFNKSSVGSWEVLGSFLRYGDVSVIPDFFYKHADTEPRAEYKLTEGSEHDAIRADFESFFGRMGQPYPPESLAIWLHSRTTPYYMLGARFGQIKHDLLTARHFMLRSRACGVATKEQVESWENEAMLGMVAERVLQKVELLSGVETVVFEASPRLAALRERFAAIAPQYSLSEISEGTVWQLEPRSNHLFITVNYKSFESGAAADVEPTIAMADLIETCRLTDQPLGF
jgi:glycosyltransferase involved in cell wall biosynthesis